LIGFRHVDPAYPFLWEGPAQPEGRWNRDGGSPTHYFADTPDGAWAEFLRHEEITDPIDLPGILRALWAVELGDAPSTRPDMDFRVLTGGRDSYIACQEVADAIRGRGEPGLTAPSAALLPAGARGSRVDSGMHDGPNRDGLVMVLFGARPDLVGWMAGLGRPDARLLPLVRQLS